MRCEDIREQIDQSWEGQLSPEIGTHLATCPACAAYLREVSLVRAGFHALAQESAPEPSLGFATRLVRRLGEATEQERAREAFFVAVGRRFVYATLVLTLGVLLALVLPSSGPVREVAVADALVAQPETITQRPEYMAASNLPDNSSFLSIDLTTRNGRGNR